MGYKELQKETEQLDCEIGRLNSMLLEHRDAYGENQP